MPAPVDGGGLHNQSQHVEDQVILLDVILLTSLITRLNIILSVENYVDINWAAQQRFWLILLLHVLSINAACLDGVSITVGNPRKHVWSYAAGFSKLHNINDINCPCAKYPVYVGDNYYCESGSNGFNSVNAFHASDPL